MRVLITGINGFVGSHLVDFLLTKSDVEIFGISRNHNSNRYIPCSPGQIHIQYTDIIQFESVKTIIKSVKPDLIFHLAGQPYVPLSLADPTETFKTNIFGTLNVLNAVKRLNLPCSILVVSSGEIYGDCYGRKGLSKETDAFDPLNPYASSKASVDLIAQEFRHYEELDIYVVRPFTHIGARQKPTFFASYLGQKCSMIRKGKSDCKLMVGRTDVQRDFTNVKDIVRAYWGIMIEKPTATVLNIGSGDIWSIADLIREFEGCAGLEFEVIMDQSRIRPRDPKLLSGDYSRLHNSINWKPEYDIASTVKEIIDYWDQN